MKYAKYLINLGFACLPVTIRFYIIMLSNITVNVKDILKYLLTFTKDNYFHFTYIDDSGKSTSIRSKILTS